MHLSLALVHDKDNKTLIEWDENQIRDMIKKEMTPWFVNRWLLLKAWDQVVLKLKAESIKIP